MDERQTYVYRYQVLLDRFAEVVEHIPRGRVDDRVVDTGSSPAIIVSDVLGSVRGSVIGIACGRDVYRNREEEFQVAGESPTALAERLRALAQEITETLGAADAPPLDEQVTPPQSLIGLQEVRELARREPLASALSHAGEHLGELQLIRDLLAEREG